MAAAFNQALVLSKAIGDDWFDTQSQLVVTRPATFRIPTEFCDLHVDGMDLLAELSDEGHWLSWRLLLEAHFDPQRNFDNPARVALAVCRDCLDWSCSCLTAVVHDAGEVVEWSDFRWASGVKTFDGEMTPALMGRRFRFRKDELEAALLQGCTVERRADPDLLF